MKIIKTIIDVVAFLFVWIGEFQGSQTGSNRSSMIIPTVVIMVTLLVCKHGGAVLERTVKKGLLECYYITIPCLLLQRNP